MRLGFGGSCPTDDVGLVVESEALHHPAAHSAVVAAANLLARWVPSLSVQLPVDPKMPTGSLVAAIDASVRNANPFLEIKWVGRPPTCPSLTIGPGAIASPSTTTAWADGWVAVSTRGSLSRCLSEPIPSVLLFAVALGVGRVFRDAWTLSRAGPSELRWDTWDHTLNGVGAGSELPRPVRPPDLGNVLQVGAGAVGSNIIYFLGLMGASADLVVVDHDVAKIENLDRSLLFGLEDAYPRETPKVEAVLQAVESFPTLRVHPERSKWVEYAMSGYRVGNFDLALALANEDQVWPAMANAVLPLTLQATTDSDWGVALGVHTPGRGYCLQCRFPPEAEVAPTVCSEGVVEIPSQAGKLETVHSSLPFQSAAAAALLAVEVDKLALGLTSATPNYVEAKLDLTSRVSSLHRAPSANCPACQAFPENLWARRYANTRFASFRQVSNGRRTV